MALGPFAKILAQGVLMGVTILARAIPAAYGAALQNAKKGGVDAAKAGEGFISRNKMAVDEALMVLNIEKNEAVTAELVQQVRHICPEICYSFSCDAIAWYSCLNFIAI